MLPTFVHVAHSLFYAFLDGYQVPIQWEEVDVTPILKNGKTVIPDLAITSVKKNTVALKGAFQDGLRGCSIHPVFRPFGDPQ